MLTIHLASSWLPISTSYDVEERMQFQVVTFDRALLGSKAASQSQRQQKNNNQKLVHKILDFINVALIFQR